MISAWFGILAAATDGTAKAGAASGRDWVAISAGFAAAIASGVVLLLEVISRSRIGKEKDATIDRMKQEVKSTDAEQAKQIETLEKTIAFLERQTSPDLLENYDAKIEQYQKLHAELKKEANEARKVQEKEKQARAAAEESDKKSTGELLKEQVLREKREKRLEEREKSIAKLEKDLARMRNAVASQGVKDLIDATAGATEAALASASGGAMVAGVKVTNMGDILSAYQIHHPGHFPLTTLALANAYQSQYEAAQTAIKNAKDFTEANDSALENVRKTLKANEQLRVTTRRLSKSDIRKPPGTSTP